MIPVAGSRPYEVHVGQGALAELPTLLARAGVRGRLAVVHDPGSAAHLGRLPPPALAVEVPRGEAAKTLAVAERVWGELSLAGLHRGDAVLALGGGAVGDLAGFVAATYHRGVPLVLAPTTLLAQVDASVGGKVAIDHPLAKNLVGAFFPPHLVVSDVDTLGTLTERERWDGLAEVVKTALIGDAQLLTSLERDLEELARGSAPAARLVEVVERCVRVKAGIVSRDEREAGERLLLNLGHTVGHGVEAAAGFGPVRHGEAVVLGLRAALLVSERAAGLARGEAARVRSLLSRFPRPRAPLPPAAAVREAALRDKKRAASGLRFVVLNRIGAAGVLPDVDPALLDAAIAAALEAPP